MSLPPTRRAYEAINSDAVPFIFSFIIYYFSNPPPTNPSFSLSFPFLTLLLLAHSPPRQPPPPPLLPPPPPHTQYVQRPNGGGGQEVGRRARHLVTPPPTHTYQFLLFRPHVPSNIIPPHSTHSVTHTDGKKSEIKNRTTLDRARNTL